MGGECSRVPLTQGVCARKAFLSRAEITLGGWTDPFARTILGPKATMTPTTFKLSDKYMHKSFQYTLF